jgi:O-antigen/teichoic acid export membrane protein
LPDSSPTPVKDLTRRTAAGMMWAMVSLVFGKFSTFIAQLVLGHLLSEDDFGLYAMAASMQLIASCVVGGGMRKVLMARADRYDELARPAFVINLWFNAIAAGIILFGTFVMSTTLWADKLSGTDAKTVLQIAVVIGVGLMISPFGSSQRVKLGIDLRYRDFTQMSTVSAVLRQGSSIGFAVLGFGPLSFALPVLVQSVVEAVYCRRLVGPLPAGLKLDKALFFNLMADAKWAILTTVGVALILQGDYFIVSTIETKAVVGLYYWGFQLNGAAMAPFLGLLGGVLTPPLGRLNAHPARQAAAFVRIIRVVCVVSMPMSIAAAMCWPWLIHVLWQGKWDAAIVVTQLMALSTCFRTLQPLATAVLEARGEFRAAAFMLIVDGALTVIAAAVGAMIGGVASIAIAVGIHRAVVSIAECMWIARRLGSSRRKIAGQMISPLAMSAVLGTVIFLAVRLLAPTDYQHVFLFGGGVLMLGLYVALARLLMPARVAELVHVMPLRARRLVPRWFHRHELSSAPVE